MPADQTPETPETEPAEETPETPEVPEDGDTFPRSYVEQLRRENAESRTKAKRADELAARVLRLEVAATGRLADAADLPYDAALLDDPDAITAAIDALLAAKPHLASRRPRGDVDQGVRETTAERLDHIDARIDVLIDGIRELLREVVTIRERFDSAR